MRRLAAARLTAARRAAERLGPARRRALAHGLAIALVIVVGYYDLLVVLGWLGVDAHAYWSAWEHGLYGVPAGHRDAYLYSPAFAQLLWPLTRLPWEAFLALWAGAMCAIFVWLLRPLPRLWLVPALLLCLPEALQGNINAVLALMIVVGFRYPAAWAFALLTKVSTAVGLVWFAARGEWRALAVPLAVAGALAAVSYALWPELWQGWLNLLTAGAANGGGTWLFPVRLMAAAGLVAWGARSGRRWTVPVGVILGSPILFLNTLTILAALPRLALLPAPATAAAADPGPARTSRTAGASADG
jgi:hypothetical protein